MTALVIGLLFGFWLGVVFMTILAIGKEGRP